MGILKTLKPKTMIIHKSPSVKVIICDDKMSKSKNAPKSLYTLGDI